MIDVISYKDDQVEKKLHQSFLQTGFAVVTDTDISPDLLNGVYSEWREFFEEYPEEERQKFKFEKNAQSGYFPMYMEKAKDQKIADLKEFYHYYPWSEKNPLIMKKTPALKMELEKLGLNLLDKIEAATPPAIRRLFTEPLSSMAKDSKQTLFRIIHYPPANILLPDMVTSGAVRAAAHEDINLITLLPMATAAGLEVKDIAGNWHQVACDNPNAIVVNIGDMLQLASYNYYPSTTHRVVNTSINERRYSMPLFMHPRPEVRLSIEKTADDYLKERLKEIGLL